MNIKRFTGRTSSEALAQVRQELGDDAVILSTKPGPNGVEVLALAPETMAQLQADAARVPSAPVAAPPPAFTPPVSAAAALKAKARSLAERITARGERLEPTLDMPMAGPAHAPAQAIGRAVIETQPQSHAGHPAAIGLAASLSSKTEAAPSGIDQDVAALGMSTLTFQDYVRERMLRRRQTETERPGASAGEALVHQMAQQSQATDHARSHSHSTARSHEQPLASHADAPPLRAVAGARLAEPARRGLLREPPVLREELPLDDGPRLPRRQVQHALPAARTAHRALDLQADDQDDEAQPPRRTAAAAAREHDEMLGELRSVRSLIEERFGMLAFMDKLDRNPTQVALSQQLFDVGLSPGMVRKLVHALPDGVPDGLAWAASVLENNLVTNAAEAAIEDHQGIFALIGPTGVGKTTSTAKIAAAFAAKHGAANLGLITLDAYRMGAHEQLRTYGRILGVAVHTAHDRASLEDLLELLSAKKMVLIDTAGMAQRDTRTRELLEMLSNPAIHKLLVVNAAAQGETVEDVMVGYRAHTCAGVIISKLDEAVKLGPALDALIRHTVKVVGVANGQRVPEDWHRLSAQALVQRVLHGGGTASWRFNASEVNLMFAATQAGHPGGAAARGRAPAGLHA